MKTERARAIVFDFDGVLVDSMDAKADVFCTLYSDQSSSIRASIRDFHLSHGGMSRSEKFKYFETVLLSRPLDAARIESLSEQFEVLVEPLVARAPEIHGATRLLHLLEGQLPLFVASATPQTELRRVVEARGWTRFFTATFGSPFAKEEILREISRRTGLRTDLVLLVGDSSSDLRAATVAGTQFVGFRDNGKNSFPEDVQTIERLEAIEGLILPQSPEAAE